jgi:hypothetical protein
VEGEFGRPGDGTEDDAVRLSDDHVEPAGSLDSGVAQRRRHWIPVSVAIIGIIGASLAVMVASGGQSTLGGSIAAADFVTAATQTTFAEHTADLIFAGSVSVSGRKIPIVGTGEANLASPQQYSATVQFSTSGNSFVEEEVLVGGHFYMGIESNGQDISSLIRGKHWVEIPTPVGADSSVGTATNDPLAQMQMLAAKGNIVTRLGEKSIEGVVTTGYAVTISRQNEQNAERRTISSGHLDAAAQRHLSEVAKSFPTPTIDVWFDSSKLLRRMSIRLDSTQNGKRVDVNMDMDYVNYGAPVAISSPLSSDVVPYNRFLAAADSASGIGG